MSDWIRVTRANPCPVCKKPDFCVVGLRFVQCMRIESDKPCKSQLGGWLHSLGDSTQLRPLPPRRHEPVVTIDAEAIMTALARETMPEMIERLAGSLGVSVRSLELIGAAWSPGHRAWGFPMKDWTGKTVGVRLRCGITGKKWAIKGSRAGLFYAEGEADEILVTEGPTDLAAAMTIGLSAVARASCMGSEEETDKLIRRKRARRVIIASDNDDVGYRGAEKLQEALSVPSVIFVPMAKDLRQAVSLGLTVEMLKSLTKSLCWHQPKRL